MSVGSSNHSDVDVPSITLSFGGPSSALWDDGELVRSYDAAMSEFHAHHPGPGSWLDKATAALALGKPLSGSQTFGTHAPGESESESTALAQVDRRPQKRKRNAAMQLDNPKANPYIGPNAHIAGRRSLPSPTFHPPSPPHGLSPSPIAPDLHANPETEGVANQDLNMNDVSTVSEAQALGYAMQAQYLAGYWMGIAQARREAAARHDSSPIS